MPLKPIAIAGTAASSNKIVPGSVLEYENHGKPMLGVALAEKKNRWLVLNQSGGELELPPNRIYLLPGSVPDPNASDESKLDFLEKLSKNASELLESLELEVVWEIASGGSKEISIVELTEIAFSTNSLENHITIRHALLEDEIYFKRKKNGYEARPENVVEELKVKVSVEQKKRARRNELLEAILANIESPGSCPMPQTISTLEQLAAVGKQADEAKASLELIDDALKRLNVPLNGRAEQKAFSLLVKAGHFSPDENLTLIRMGRSHTFPKELEEEAQKYIDAVDTTETKRSDLSHLKTITIDAESTKDFDDAISLEKTDAGFRVGIHISDVAAVIAPDSELEREGFARGTSIYCPDSYIPMFPRSLSERTLSLVQGEPRFAMSFFVTVDAQLEIINREIIRSLVIVDERLTYEQADAVLYDEKEEPTLSESTKEMLLDLWGITSSFEAKRLGAGALQFNRREMSTKVDEQGVVKLESNADDTPGHKVISELMILTNETAALFAKEKNIPLVFRGQEEPDVALDDQGHEIPEGPAREFFQRSFLKRSETGTEPLSHFGLGLEAYSQITSPIRRAVDLINQRQIAAMLDCGAAFYTQQELLETWASTESSVSEVFQIQRERRRYWLLKYIKQEKITEIEGTVMKTDGHRPLVELDHIYAMFPFNPIGKKKSENGGNGKFRGERVKLHIENVDPRNERIVLQEIEK